MAKRKLKNSELNRKSINEFKSAGKLPVIIVLDNIRSLNNIGSVFRTSDAFLVESIYLCGITATPPNRDIHKTALGATESVEWQYFEQTTEAVSSLKEQGYTIICLEQTVSSITLDTWMPNTESKYALIFGNEVRGVEQGVIDMCDTTVEIPQFGTKHSFNITVSVGIVLWDLYTKSRLKLKL